MKLLQLFLNSLHKLFFETWFVRDEEDLYLFVGMIGILKLGCIVVNLLDIPTINSLANI